MDIIKIDKTFIDDLCTDSRDQAIVRAILLLCKMLGVRVIAEGIETLEQARKLRDMGCDTGQGYLFGRPMPIDSVEAYLMSQPQLRA